VSPLTERTNTRPEAILGLRGGCPLLEGGGDPLHREKPHLLGGSPPSGEKAGSPLLQGETASKADLFHSKSRQGKDVKTSH